LLERIEEGGRDALVDKNSDDAELGWKWSFLDGGFG
jgi:hypothetical protein